MRRHLVTRPGRLLETLYEAFPESPRGRLKQALRHALVSVNGAPATRHDHPVAPGDRIEVAGAPPASVRKTAAHTPFPIVHEDDTLLVIDKPAGLLTMATDEEKERTAYHALTDYVRAATRDPEARIFIVHRLDREVSGLCLFARTESAKRALQDGWEEVEKRYFAIVSGRLDPPEGEIRSRLAEDERSLRVFSTRRRPDSKAAVTRYRTVRAAGRYSLLEIHLVTGRKNQIRVHLQDLGHPIVGDRKYGHPADPAGRIALHACALSFDHPVSGDRIMLTRPLPRALEALVPPPGRDRPRDRRR